VRADAYLEVAQLKPRCAAALEAGHNDACLGSKKSALRLVVGKSTACALLCQRTGIEWGVYKKAIDPNGMNGVFHVMGRFISNC
jgi:hypothetical protein